MRKKILIVDDEKEICELLSNFLKKKGFEPYKVHNGIQALAFIKKTRPDLVILDVIMPVMDGFMVLKKLKGNTEYSEIPVIMLTQKSQPQSLGRGISLSADFYLPKPFRLENLMEFINLVL